MRLIAERLPASCRPPACRSPVLRYPANSRPQPLFHTIAHPCEPNVRFAAATDLIQPRRARTTHCLRYIGDKRNPYPGVSTVLLQFVTNRPAHLPPDRIAETHGSDTVRDISTPGTINLLPTICIPIHISHLGQFTGPSATWCPSSNQIRQSLIETIGTRRQTDERTRRPAVGAFFRLKVRSFRKNPHQSHSSGVHW